MGCKLKNLKSKNNEEEKIEPMEKRGGDCSYKKKKTKVGFRVRRFFFFDKHLRNIITHENGYDFPHQCGFDPR